MGGWGGSVGGGGGAAIDNAQAFFKGVISDTFDLSIVWRHGHVV